MGEKPEGQRDRALGALIGLAVGDAVGTTLEFKSRDSYPPLTDMVGGGPFSLSAGQWTDDTAMALALADSLLSTGEIDESDILRRFHDWWQNGSYSCTGHCFDIGSTVRAALLRWRTNGERHAGSTDSSSAGNGSLMRLSPVAIRFTHDRAKLKTAAERQSRTTHGAPEAVDACIFFAEILADAIEGKPKGEVLQPRGWDLAGAISAIAAGSWIGKPRREIKASGYVAHSLEAALWAVGETSNFRDAVLVAANLGEDADTTAAIAGQLAGALYGASSIPSGWMSKLAWRDLITSKASDLWQHSLAELVTDRVEASAPHSTSGKSARLEAEIRRLTRPINGQYPRPWMTNFADPSSCRVFVVGRNPKHGFDADAVGAHDRYVDALFNREGRGIRELYDSLAEKPSPTRRNSDSLVRRLATFGVPDVLETNVVCYSTQTSDDLGLARHSQGAQRGREIFQALLELIEPKVLVVHGEGARGDLETMLRHPFPEAPLGPDDLRMTDVDGMRVFVIPSLAPPAYNRWSKWADQHLDKVSAKVADFLAVKK